MIINDLECGVLVKRYKRFFADVKLPSGEVVTAHCPNTGSMKSLIYPDTKAWIRFVDNPKRKLKYTLEFLELSDGTLACVNTQRPNHIVEEAVRSGIITELAEYKTLRAEVKYGLENSRIDLLTESAEGNKTYIEVKNVTLSLQPEQASFPDAVTTRGTKHIRELQWCVEQGFRGVLFFLVSRSDCSSFKPAWEIDPAYCETLQTAVKAGVEVLIYQTNFSRNGNSWKIEVSHVIPATFSP